MHPFSWFVVWLALLNVVFLASLPLLAQNAADQFEPSRPDALPPRPHVLEKREVPIVPVEDLHEALRLPRVDESLTDEHSKEALAAYEVDDYEWAFEKAVLSLDPTPLEKNELYRVLTNPETGQSYSQTVEKPNGRPALEAVDDVLKPILRTQDPRKAAVRLNNASALMTLRDYKMGPSAVPFGLEVSEELAFQAADLRPSYCPALLNLAMYDSASFGGDFYRPVDFDTDFDLKPAGYGLYSEQTDGSTWKDYYPAEGCKDPALLFYRAQGATGLRDLGAGMDERGRSLRLIDRLEAVPGWAGLAHSVRGDAYYWFGLYSFERTQEKRPFTARRYFKLALTEYDAALRIQPDDTAVHHGKALAYLELGKTDDAIQEAETAWKAAPDSPRLQQTLVGAYEEKGLYGKAVRLNSNFLSTQQPASTSPKLVPYSAISHGADRYSQLGVYRSGGGGPIAFVDDEVITKFEPRLYYSRVANWDVPDGLNQWRNELSHYRLLRDVVLSRNYGALDESLRSAPEEVRDNESVLLLAGVDSLLNQSRDEVVPTKGTQALIEDFLAAYEPFAASWTGHYAGLPFQANDLFYLEASNFFRQHEQYDIAIRVYRVWQTELEQAGADDDRRAEVERLLGEAYFLKGKTDLSDQEEPPREYGEALGAFERAERLRRDWPTYVVRQAFMYEKLGEFDVAEYLYGDALKSMRQPAEWTEGYEDPIDFYYPESYQAMKHRGDVLLRKADVTERANNRDDQAVFDGYEKAARDYREARAQKRGSVGEVPDIAATNNLGIAHLLQGDYEAGIKVLEPLVQPYDSSSVSSDQKSITPDEHNPIFRLNLGWAYQLNGEPKKAAAQYLSAVKSFPSFYTALNDLGVLAAKKNDVDAAKGYFDAALKANGDYDHAAFNMGVALLHSGPENFLAAQHYFGRAVAENPALSEARYEYISDNELYFLKLSLLDRVPGNWQFSTHAERSTGALSLLVLGLLLGRIAVGYASSTLQGTFFGTAASYSRRMFLSYARNYGLIARLRDGLVRFMHLGLTPSGGWWMTPIALLVSAPAIVVVMGWDLIRGESSVKLLMLGVLLYLAVVSLLVHHAGHALAAWWFKMRVQEASWPASIIPALALAVIGGPAVAPVPASVIEEAAEVQEGERSLVYLAGPAASIIFAALLLLVFLLSHIPLLRLGAIISLAVAVVSLLLLPPLDGAMVGGRRYRRLLFWIGITMTVLWALVYFSNQFYCLGSPGDYCWGVWF